MTDLYIQQISTYQSDCPCILGKFPMFSHYIQDFAKEMHGHGLDVGAGPQGCNGKFFENCQTLDGCDALQEVVDSLPAKYTKKFVYFLGREEPLPYNDQTKDFVVCSCVVQHLNSHEELDKGISEMTRVLKKGGTHDSLLTHFNRYYGQQRTFRVFAPQNVNEILKKYGLQVIREQKAMDDNWIPYVNVIAEKR